MTIKNISDHELLKSFNDLIPLIPFWFDDEVVFTISNKVRFLKVVNSKNIKLNAHDGDLIPLRCCAYECLKEQKPISVIVPKEVFGVELKAFGIPVKDNTGEIAGTFVIARIPMKQDTSMYENIANGTDEVLNFVNDIYQETNLSDFHEKIEAVRAGDLGRGFNAIAQEIRKLQILSRIDDLTCISNRRYFYEVFIKEYKSASSIQQPISLLMIDIDFFKNYNDFYGHIQGDNCLKDVAQAINKEIKRAGDFVARYGGEEFVVLLPNTDLNGAKEVSDKIIDAVASLDIPHKASPVSSIVTVSVGVGTMTSFEGCDYLNLLDRADKALYKAKEGGKNRIEYFLQ